jgi:crotonobetainyl-CoA:carnitine CoA-transferase CaiB-like acyl-CoA transferase
VHHFFPHAELDGGTAPIAEETLLTGGAPCYRVYETADGGLLAVGALELKFWQIFCTAIGLPELQPNHWTLGEAPGSDDAHRTARQVAQRLRAQALAHWQAVFERVDACVAPVLSPSQALAHPQFAARRLVQRRGEVTHVGPLAQLTDHEFTVRAAPSAGQHTRDLLRELGYSADEIDAMLASGAARDS